MPHVTDLVKCIKKFGKLGYTRNFPQAYIDRVKKTVPKRIYGNRFGAPDMIHYKKHPDNFVNTAYRPWEQQAMEAQFEFEEKMRRRKCLYLGADNEEPLPDERWWFFKGDTVQVQVGKDKGKCGVITRVSRESNSVFVRGLHLKFEDRMGTVVPVEQPLNVKKGEVKLYNKADGEATEVVWKYREDGETIRCCTRTEKELAIPSAAYETFEYSTADTYEENSKDTPSDEVLKNTNQIMSLGTFEEDILEELKRKGPLPPRRRKTYWY